MSAKMSFETASMLIGEEEEFTAIEISIDFEANAPMHALNEISSARGISTGEGAFFGMTLSEDKTTFSIPVEVNLSSLEDFCDDITNIVAKQYLRGFHMTHIHDMKQSLCVAIDTILTTALQKDFVLGSRENFENFMDEISPKPQL